MSRRHPYRGEIESAASGFSPLGVQSRAGCYHYPFASARMKSRTGAADRTPYGWLISIEAILAARLQRCHRQRRQTGGGTRQRVSPPFNFPDPPRVFFNNQARLRVVLGAIAHLAILINMQSLAFIILLVTAAIYLQFGCRGHWR